MEILLIAVIIILAVIIFILAFHLLSVRQSMREMTRELEEKLSADTNTLISVSSGDRAVRAFASQINKQLLKLRSERLRLQNGDAELKTAITNISHDLRTPLTAICGYLDLLEREEHTQTANRYISVIRERTDAMRVLTRELLDYSVITSQADALARESVSINDILEQSLSGFYGVLVTKNITPDIEMPDEKVIRMLDSTALRRVFDNIISNAAKYSDGDLSVALTSDGAVIFSNKAENLDSVRAAKLFDRFYTLETGRDSVGLGLSAAKLLTEKMGGSCASSYENGRLSVRLAF